MKVIKDGKVIIVGRRNATNGLWNVPLALKGPLPAQLASPPLAISPMEPSSISEPSKTLPLAFTLVPIARNLLHFFVLSNVVTTPLGLV